MSNPLSYSSVKLDLFSKDGTHLWQASGFVVETVKRHYLITNRHVVLGRVDPPQESPEPSIEPYLLKTSIHILGGAEEHSFPLSWGVWKKITIPLYDNADAPQWIECQANEQNQLVPDVIALPIPLGNTLRYNQLVTKFGESTTENDFKTRYWAKISALPFTAIETAVEYTPPDAVYIVGYPLGWAPAGKDKSSAAFWRTSAIASEMKEIGKLPENIFFIDPGAPEGMSGSPVIGMKHDRLKLLGVYSDHPTAGFRVKVGHVWDARLVKEMIDVS